LKPKKLRRDSLAADPESDSDVEVEYENPNPGKITIREPL
jgi:hypothetical protein